MNDQTAINTQSAAPVDTASKLYGVPRFMELVSYNQILEAIEYGLNSKDGKLIHMATLLRDGKWKSKSTGMFVRAQPGYGFANPLAELNRVIEMLGEDEAYLWASNRPEMKGFVFLWRQGRFHLFDGTYLAPPAGYEPVAQKPSGTSSLAEARKRRQERSDRDKAERAKRKTGASGEAKKQKRARG